MTPKPISTPSPSGPLKPDAAFDLLPSPLLDAKAASALLAVPHTWLLAEGYIAAEKDGQAHRHRSLRPYREDADSPTESTESQPSPNRVPDPLAATESIGPSPTGRGDLRDPVSSNGSGEGRSALDLDQQLQAIEIVRESDPDMAEEALARVRAKFGDVA